MLNGTAALVRAAQVGRQLKRCCLRHASSVALPPIELLLRQQRRLHPLLRLLLQVLPCQLLRRLLQCC